MRHSRFRDDVVCQFHPTSTRKGFVGGMCLLLIAFLPFATAADPKENAAPEPAWTRFEGLKAAITQVKISPDGKIAIAGGKDGKDGQLVLIDLETGKELRRLNIPKDELTSLTFSADSRRVLA